MIDAINQLIDLNLQLFYTANQKQLQLKDFRDLYGKQISGAKLLANIMQQKELIQPILAEKNTYQLTEHGNNICLYGGWQKHTEKEMQQQTISPEETSSFFDSLIKKLSNILFFITVLVVTLIIVYLL